MLAVNRAFGRADVFPFEQQARTEASSSPSVNAGWPLELAALVRPRRRWEFDTPGHSLGHICLWSRPTNSGSQADHLLPAVTPPVTFERGFDNDPLPSYVASLQLVAERNPALVLPGARTGIRRQQAPYRRDESP
jgi:glyoxylase-like metal-dependent hydrolase (beta-lactamase superfamily II)